MSNSNCAIEYLADRSIAKATTAGKVTYTIALAVAAGLAKHLKRWDATKFLVIIGLRPSPST